MFVCVGCSMGVLAGNGCDGGTKRAGAGGGEVERGTASSREARMHDAGWVGVGKRGKGTEEGAWQRRQRVGGAKCMALLKATKGAALVLADGAQRLAPRGGKGEKVLGK